MTAHKPLLPSRGASVLWAPGRFRAPALAAKSPTPTSPEMKARSRALYGAGEIPGIPSQAVEALKAARAEGKQEACRIKLIRAQRMVHGRLSGEYRKEDAARRVEIDAAGLKTKKYKSARCD